jgi:hypothetical protein
MIRIKDTIFSLDIIEKKFKCDLQMCLGNCCRYGDSGAPLEDHEIGVLEEIWPDVKPYLRQRGIAVIEKEGTSITDFEGDKVTPLIGKEECAYSTLEGNIFMCGIEKAFIDGTITFQKPLSCHLFPARVKQYKGFRTVNYQELSLCHQAVKCGNEEGIYLYEFLRNPFIRAFGEATYKEICITAEEYRKFRGNFKHE